MCVCVGGGGGNILLCQATNLDKVTSERFRLSSVRARSQGSDPKRALPFMYLLIDLLDTTVSGPVVGGTHAGLEAHVATWCQTTQLELFGYQRLCCQVWISEYSCHLTFTIAGNCDCYIPSQHAQMGDKWEMWVPIWGPGWDYIVPRPRLHSTQT